MDRVSGRSHALMPLLSSLGLVFNVTPSSKNTHEFNARFLQMKTSGLLFHAIQIFPNNAIGDMHGREESPFQVCKWKSEDTVYRLLITMVEETFDIRRS